MFVFSASLFGCIRCYSVLFNFTTNGTSTNVPICNHLRSNISGIAKSWLTDWCRVVGWEWRFHWSSGQYTNGSILWILCHIRHHSWLLEVAHLCKLCTIRLWRYVTKPKFYLKTGNFSLKFGFYFQVRFWLFTKIANASSAHKCIAIIVIQRKFSICYTWTNPNIGWMWLHWCQFL